jgi:hypothetical protein
LISNIFNLSLAGQHQENCAKNARKKKEDWIAKQIRSLEKLNIFSFKQPISFNDYSK